MEFCSFIFNNLSLSYVIIQLLQINLLLSQQK